MSPAGGWTKAGSLNTMTVTTPVSCQGADHDILPPAPLAGHLLRAPGLCPRCPLGPPPPPAVVRPPLRPRPAHLHGLVPRRRHHRRVPPGLHHDLGLRPPDPPRR